MIVRAPTPADAETVAELCAAYDRAHGAPADTSADDLREEWADLDLERDAWLIELDGGLAAYACVYGREGRWSADGYVRPDLRGRGLGCELLRLTEERARGLGAESLRNATLHADAAGRALFEAHGYDFVRAFLRMEIELDAEPSEPQVPDGLVLEPARPGDERALHETIQEAFADHWGHVREEFDAWRRRRLDGEDIALSYVVRDGGEVVAASVNQAERFGGGWVAALGTRRAYRRRGLGEALLRTSLREFRRRGATVVRLGVDSESPTGAVRLYERVGMHVIWRADVYEKRL